MYIAIFLYQNRKRSLIMPQFNAIRVSDKIEKVFIDFSSYESLKESSCFKKPYTIHTAETLEITHLLGFHVGGFCDDHGNKTNLLAGKISGYGTLPSDLILCLMDDHYEFLPLSDEQLDCLYIYLITGKVVDPNVDETARKFFAKYKIYPVLPKLGTDCESFINKKHPNVLILKYDFDFNKIPENQITKIGEALFHYADCLINTFKEVDDVYLSMDETYFVKALRDLESSAYIVLIQACINKNEKPVLNEIDIHNLVKSEEVIEDTIEEVLEPEDDADEGAVLIFEVEAEWPNSKDRFSFSGKYAIPLFAPESIKPSIPYFEKFFEITGIDRINDVMTLMIHEGEKDRPLTLPLGNKVAYDFNYYSRKRNKKTLRKGRAWFKYVRPYFTVDSFPGIIRVDSKYLVNGKLEDGETGYFETINDDPDIGGYIDNSFGDRFFVFAYSYIENFALLYCYSPDPDNDDEFLTYYYPLYLNEKSGSTTTLFDVKKKQTLTCDIEISYEERTKDEQDDLCILEIHEKYAYKDIHDEFESEETYTLDVKDGNKIELKRGKCVSVCRIDSRLHEAVVYIGNSFKPEDCKFNLVICDGDRGHYKSSFSGGVNENYHAESIDIEVRMIKR